MIYLIGMVYSISDNFTRFYYTFIVGKEHYLQIVGEDGFYDKFIQPYLWQFISLRFEDLVKEYFVCGIQEKQFSDVMDVGRFWYNNPETKTVGEFDVVLKHFDNSYSFYEVKCHQDKISEKECMEEEQQILGIDARAGIRIKDIGFVALNGFDFDSDKYKLITGGMLF